MARVRPARCYRKVERPWTRVSRFSKKNYVKGAPPTKIRMFEFGQLRGDENYELKLVCLQPRQIRDIAIEAARVQIRKTLEKVLGNSGYRVIINKYPHQILREHKLANVAKADRFFQGMRLAFGKPIGRAIIVKRGDVIFTIKINQKFAELARKALKKAAYKIGCKTTIVERKLKDEVYKASQPADK